MEDDDSKLHNGPDTLDIELEALEDAPTDRLSSSGVVPKTDPTHAGVLDAATANVIQQNFAETVQDDDRITFVAFVDQEGRIVVPDRLLKGKDGIRPGDELLIQAKKID